MTLEIFVYIYCPLRNVIRTLPRAYSTYVMCEILCNPFSIVYTGGLIDLTPFSF